MIPGRLAAGGASDWKRKGKHLFKRNRARPTEELSAAARRDDAAHEVLVSIRTDVGCVREANEDSGVYFKPSDPTEIERQGILVVVADGMGGHASGEVASRMAVETVKRAYYREKKGSADALRVAFEEANARIYAAAHEDPSLLGMGTTGTALVILGGHAFAAHVGDSRLYMLRGGDLYQLTEDHSEVMEMVKRGIISQEEARTHENKNVILRALGTGPAVEVSTWDAPLAVRPGDQFLLCSDGLHDMVEDAEIREIVAASADPHDACDRLVAKARERGGHDNITVGIAAVVPKGTTGTVAGSLRETREVETIR